MDLLQIWCFVCVSSQCHALVLHPNSGSQWKFSGFWGKIWSTASTHETTSEPRFAVQCFVVLKVSGLKTWEGEISQKIWAKLEMTLLGKYAACRLTSCSNRCKLSANESKEGNKNWEKALPNWVGWSWFLSKCGNVVVWCQTSSLHISLSPMLISTQPTALHVAVVCCVQHAALTQHTANTEHTTHTGWCKSPRNS